MMDRGLDMAPHRLDYYMAQARRHAGSGLFRRVALLAMSACLGPGAVSGTRELFNRFDEVSLCSVLELLQDHLQVPVAFFSRAIVHWDLWTASFHAGVCIQDLQVRGIFRLRLFHDE